ncbi:MAG: hypothetical protein R3B48_01020 [Kofleriaceae bacterium]
MSAEPPGPPASPERQRAPRWQRAYLVACCALIGAAIAYWLAHWAQLPILCYAPLERRWTFSPPSDGPVITYLGIVLWGASGFAVGAALGALAAAVWRQRLGASALRLLGAWALTGFVLCGWYYTWNLWPF